MGGVFSSPKKPEVVDYDAIAKQKADEERKKNLERQRRGIEGTIKTSYTGILKTKSMEQNRKNLLGD